MASIIYEQAAQCGDCISSMIMSAKTLLDRNPKPGDGEIRGALAGNLCRCRIQIRIPVAARSAAEEMA